MTVSESAPRDDSDTPRLLPEQYRNYLLLLARTHLGGQARGRIDASDIVQHTLLEAHENLPRFRGTTERELAAWLRRILACQLSTAHRTGHRAKRDVTRERSIHAALDDNSARLEAWLAAEQSSPSCRAERRELVLRVVDALSDLPEAQREAMILRHSRGWSLQEIGAHMGCSAPAVVGLLKRGAKRLRLILNGEDTAEDAEEGL